MKTRLAVLLAAAAATAALAEDPICFEAEDADQVSAPVQVVTATNAPAGDAAASLRDAAGTAFIEVPQGAGNPPKVNGGEAVYAVDLAEAGDYVLWCRAWWSDECGNSLTVRLDDTAAFSLGQDSTLKSWHWVRSPARVKQLTLAAGRHTLRLINREDGVRIDQVLLTRDAKYVPVDREAAKPRKPATGG